MTDVMMHTPPASSGSVISRRGVGPGDEQRDEHHRRPEGDDVRLEQVRRHAGAVADIVADVVGDDAGVAVVVLVEAEFVLADHVGPDVGGLGEDATTQSREDRDQRTRRTRGRRAH